ncbi:flagellar hook-basal body complex protein [Lysobacter gummosus]|uniref:Flagellar hook protein FlgE n=1 Tax=Lysobacter gummosus TaxID=262324 RepID=A0ABY3XBJ1_9GAMM|nr:flagellar hook-basal body complex protein [Lysobacter gummosus]ALN93532.1 flagellar hook-basal body family protein [Lysobacter gummosus]UNP28980.1 flagellar hook-basal body complex protein [Lysobacter gummosus]
MLDSIYIGMSGLTAHSKGLQTISNNVANLNTPGFKTTTPRFSDLYYGQRFFGEGPDSARITSAGSGVEYSYSSLNFKQGEIRKSDGQLDLGIEGPGFLALLGEQGVRYARTGQFVIKDDGTIREKNNDLQLTTLAADGSLVPVSLDKQRVSPPKATSSIKFNGNLIMAAAPAAGAPNTDVYSIPNVELYDAAGTKIVATVKFTRDRNAASTLPSNMTLWQVKLETKDGQSLGQGQIRFISSIIESGADQLEITIKSGAGDSKVKLDFSSLSQYSNSSDVRVTKADGYGMGTMASLNVNDTGALVVNYSNGQTTELGTVAMANFSDPQRLIQLGDGLFDASQLPPPNYVGSKQGAGELASGVTEASNVDLSTEFGRLILIQRGFQASSQVISTANEMIMQLFQMKSGQG